MEQVIHRKQSSCVASKTMADNISFIREVLCLSSSLVVNVGLATLDQEKAFDRVEHRFLWKVMEPLGFNTGFIARIQVLYTLRVC